MARTPTLIRGDNASIPVTIPAGAVDILTGATAFLTIKSEDDVLTDDTSDTAAVVKKQLALASEALSFTFSLVPADTVNVTPGVYKWEVQIVTAANKTVTVKLRPDDVEIVADITRRTS